MSTQCNSFMSIPLFQFMCFNLKPFNSVISICSCQFIPFNSFMSISSCQFLLFNSCISHHSLQFFHFNSFILIYSLQFLHFNSHHFNSFIFSSSISFPSFQLFHFQFILFESFWFIRFNSFMSIHFLNFTSIPSFQFFHFNSFMTIHLFQFMRFNSFTSSHSCHLIHLNSFILSISFHFNSPISNSPWIPIGHVPFSKLPPRRVPGTTWYVRYIRLRSFKYYQIYSNISINTNAYYTNATWGFSFMSLQRRLRARPPPSSWHTEQGSGCHLGPGAFGWAPDIWSNTHQVEDLVLAPQVSRISTAESHWSILKHIEAYWSILKHIEAVNVLVCNMVFDLATTPLWSL